MNRDIKIHGFTLLEILLVISLILFMFGLSMPVYNTMLYGSEIENGNKILVSTLRRAQNQAMANSDNSKWGVYLTTTNVTLFKGNTYFTRDNTADTIYTLPATLSVSGPSGPAPVEITFTKKYGVPSITGTITLSLNGKTANIVINSKIVQSY